MVLMLFDVELEMDMAVSSPDGCKYLESIIHLRSVVLSYKVHLNFPEHQSHNLKRF